ncbi:hypothetical protein D3C84_624410 [compost metagenome]
MPHLAIQRHVQQLRLGVALVAGEQVDAADGEHAQAVLHGLDHHRVELLTRRLKLPAVGPAVHHGDTPALQVLIAAIPGRFVATPGEEGHAVLVEGFGGEGVTRLALGGAIGPDEDIRLAQFDHALRPHPGMQFEAQAVAQLDGQAAQHRRRQADEMALLRALVDFRKRGAHHQPFAGLQRAAEQHAENKGQQVAWEAEHGVDRTLRVRLQQ